MSLVWPSDMSTSPGNTGNYSLQGESTSSEVYNRSDQLNILYMDESTDCESYDPKFFLDSPSDQELMHPSTSDSMGRVEFDEERMRMTLQELERALLDDDDNDGIDSNMELDGERAHKARSASTDSDISVISSNKASLVFNQGHTAKHLLFECASAISEGNLEEASTMINELRQMVSLQGEPPQRIAAYMVEGLAARLASSGKFLYKVLKCKEPPSTERLAAMQILFEGCPCFKFGFMTANGAIMEAIREEKKVHLVDFDINQGNQYITLIQSLAKQSGNKLPKIRLTGIDDPESVQRSIGGLKTIGQRLEQLAEVLAVPFKFQALAAMTSGITPQMLACQPGEVLIVNFAFQLHHMPDESVSTVNERDQLLQMVKALNPKLVTVVEQDVNTNTAPFLPRFAEAYSYYSAVFESLDVTFARESQDRVNVEKQCLARDIVNIVACEGEDRIERYEVAGKWRARMMMAGFRSSPISKTVSNAIQQLMEQYCDRYTMKEEMGALCFGWERKNLIVASAWT